jgi:hypothetical protein
MYITHFCLISIFFALVLIHLLSLRQSKSAKHIQIKLICEMYASDRPLARSADREAMQPISNHTIIVLLNAHSSSVSGGLLIVQLILIRSPAMEPGLLKPC